MIDDPCGAVEYDESGAGRTVVLVPGSCSTGAAWRPLITQWQGSYRCITTSLLGYGRTAERRTAADNDIAREADIIEAVITRAGPPVDLVGHSFGGLAALVLALRRPDLLRSLAILEAPGPEILKACREPGHYAAFRSMTEQYFNAYRAGRLDAIGTMVDFYGGDGTFAAWPPRLRDYAIASTEVNMRDWACAYGCVLTPAILSRVTTPTLVVYGETSHGCVKRANELLGWSIPDADVVMLGDAAHFMIATHPRQLATLLTRHFTSARARASSALPAG
jgi:pimeloyl-ACP methyl ester carboxylesterase